MELLKPQEEKTSVEKRKIDILEKLYLYLPLKLGQVE